VVGGQSEKGCVVSKLDEREQLAETSQHFDVEGPCLVVRVLTG
jgi:hypothetical protein